MSTRSRRGRCARRRRRRTARSAARASCGAIAERLRAGERRLLTLTGPGGVGKTRLALEAARAVQADFADGAWFVSLAAVERSRDVAGAIVSALGIVPVAGRVARGGGRTLLGRQAPAAGGRTTASTCRRPRRSSGGCRRPARASRCWPPVASRWPSRPNRSFPCRRSRCPTRHAQRPRCVARASTPWRCSANARERTTPTSSSADDSAGAVAAICRRLDGLPLAIELAAARCALLSPSEIAARLDVALSALGSGPRDAPARQQTLRATLDWSHGLLDDDEQACFARYGRVRRGRDGRGGETIAGADLDTLDRLVAKSLLVRRRGRHGPTRLGMLETVRAYAGERFAALPDREAVRERHFAHSLARRSPPRDRFGARRPGHARAPGVPGRRARELPRRACDSRPSATRPSGCSSSPPRSSTTGSGAIAPTRPSHWVLPALRKTAATADPALRARALGKVFWPLWDTNRTDELPALLTEAETLARTVPDLAIPSRGAL